MTAINIFLRENAASIVSDGAAVDTVTGIIGGVGSKVFLLPNIPAAVIARGPIISLPALWLSLMKFSPSTFEELRLRIARDLESEFAPYVKAAPQMRDIDIGAAGWAGGRPSAFFISSTDMHEIAPWEPLALEPNFVMPATPELLEVVPNALEASFDPIRDGFGLLQAQRRLYSGGYPGPSRCSVGGFAQITEIRRDTIVTRILGKWPDEIGRGIDPAAGTDFST